MLKFVQDSEYIRVFKNNVPLINFSRLFQIYYDKYGNSDFKQYFAVCLRFRVHENFNTEFFTTFTTFYQSRSDFFQALNNNSILSYSDDGSSFISIISLKSNPTIIYDDSLHSAFDLNFTAGIPVGYPHFYTDLYPELLDNSNFTGWYNAWFAGSSSPAPTSDDFKTMELIEKYNKNVLLLRSTRKVEIDKEISLSSDSSSEIDLSPITNQLLNLNSKLEITRRDANNQTFTENITKVLDDSIDTKSVVVETVEKAPFNPYLNDDDNDIYGV